MGRGTPRGRHCVMTTDELRAEVLKCRRRLLSSARVPKSVVRRGTEGVLRRAIDVDGEGPKGMTDVVCEGPKSRA